MAEMAGALIPGRSCGDCTACCTGLRIDSPEFQKLSAVTCQHCTGTGCSIYPNRYPVCRAFYCAYRTSEWIDETLRPDHSGVLPVFLAESPPADYAGQPMVRFLVMDDAHLNAPALIQAICRSIAAGHATEVAVNGPRGRPGLSRLLNPSIRDIDPAAWPARIGAELRSAYDLFSMLVQISNSVPAPFQHAPPVSGAPAPR